MDRIKDVTKVFLKTEDVLLEIVLPSGLILAPNTNLMADYCLVVAKGQGVPLEVGTIVLDVHNMEQQYQFKHNDKLYLIVPYYMVKLSVEPDNFEFKKKNSLIVN